MTFGRSMHTFKLKYTTFRPSHKAEYTILWAKRRLTTHFHSSACKFRLCLEDIEDSTGLENEQILQTSVR